MKQIQLTKNEFALVDDSDFDVLNQWKWYCDHGYARRRTGPRKNAQYIYMHRFILNAPENKQVDHIDGNRLNNQKFNLRLVTKSQNMMNTDLRKDNTSGVKGVHWDISRNKWSAQIRLNKKSIYLGRFDKIEDAIDARQQAEVKYHGSFAKSK